MIIEAFLIGLVIGFIFYELTGISPGGVVAPAYFALFIHEPEKIAVTLLLAAIVWSAVLLSSRYLIIYGRRRLLAAILLGFSMKVMIDFAIRPAISFPLDLQSIGYIIPGLVGNEMIRQKFLPTLSSIIIVTVMIYFILLLLV